MVKPRGRSHTTLTETADIVVGVIMEIPGIKMIAPGEIKTRARRGAGKRHLTIVETRAGVELIITGQSVQLIAVHTSVDPKVILTHCRTHKRLRDFSVSTRQRLPGT